MMRLIDADALIKYANNSTVGIDANDIARFPRVDAVPVVRCRECKYYFGDGLGICEMIKSRLAACQRDVRWNDEFYCAFGERKDGAE
jgi:hypothetical protein